MSTPRLLWGSFAVMGLLAGCQPAGPKPAPQPTPVPTANPADARLSDGTPIPKPGDLPDTDVETDKSATMDRKLPPDAMAQQIDAYARQLASLRARHAVPHRTVGNAQTASASKSGECAAASPEHRALRRAVS